MELIFSINSHENVRAIRDHHGAIHPQLPKIPAKPSGVHVPQSFCNVFVRFGTIYQSQNRRNALIGRCGVIIWKSWNSSKVVLYKDDGEVVADIEISRDYDIIAGNEYLQLRDQDAVVWRIVFDYIEDRDEFVRLCKLKDIRILYKKVVDRRDKEIAELKKQNAELKQMNDDLNERNSQWQAYQNWNDDLKYLEHT